MLGSLPYRHMENSLEFMGIPIKGQKADLQYTLKNALYFNCSPSTQKSHDSAPK